MDRLTNVPIETLQDALDRTDEKKPTKRLIAAIAYKNGITQSDLAEWFDVERKTIYNWLERIEEGNLQEAIHDGNRPGRPRKLGEDELDQLEDALHDPPTGVGYEAPAWTVQLVQEFLYDRFEINYSRPSCRRLMKELGLRYQKPRIAAAEADTEARDEFEEELKQLGHVWMPR